MMILIQFCLLIILFLSTINANTLQVQPKILIVGAGASGIAAASKLLKNGLTDVVILEAEDRIGGRIFTTKFGNYSVDLGGQWVHGEKGNAAYDLAWPLGLLEHSDRTQYGFTFYTPSGNTPLTKNQTADISNFYLQIENNFKNYAEEGKLQTMGDIYRKALELYFESHPDIEPYKSQLSHFFELIILSTDSAMSWDDIMAYNEWGIPGDRLINWKDRGYSTILDILMEKYPDVTKELPVMERTNLGTEVNKIDYSDNNTKVKVHTKNGDMYEADHVIVTTSLGVLKAYHKNLFEPNLPEDKKLFIENYGFGSVTKIYLLFDHNWWINKNDKTFGLNILWTDGTRNNPDKKWQHSVVAIIPVEHKPNLLCIWLSGKGAIEVEKIPEHELKSQINEMLDIFKKDYNVTQPKKILRSQWYSNEHFRGTYSYTSMDAGKINSDQNSFNKPIDANLRILFAGEATENVTSSTVHGAISSGWREANRLLHLYNITNII